MQSDESQGDRSESPDDPSSGAAPYEGVPSPADAVDQTPDLDPPPVTMPTLPQAADRGTDLRFQPGTDSTMSETTSPPVQAPGPAVGSASPASTDAPGTQPPAAAAPTDSGVPPAEWLEQVCPYLLSEDGTWRSTQPDPGHRCMAQDPPGQLPPMFQERYCLTDSHVRCEWFKAAQEGAPAVAAEQDVQPVKGVTTSPTGGAATPSASGGGRKPPSSARPVLIAGAVIGGFLLLVLIAVVFGTGDGSDPIDPDATPVIGSTATSGATAAPASTDAPTVTPEPTDPPRPSAIPIRYEVQEDERLVRIGEKFGIRRAAILRANPDIDPKEPDIRAGQEIIVPAPGDMSRDQLEAIAGFVAFVDEGGG